MADPTRAVRRWSLARVLLIARLRSAWGAAWEQRFLSLGFPETPAQFRAYSHNPNAQIDLALDEAAAALDWFGSEWKPIDDKAKNGELYILGRTSDDFRIIAFWGADTGQPYRWFTADGPGYHSATFTHYMPLPAPPSSGASDG